jgi:hypothetical protein
MSLQAIAPGEMPTVTELHNAAGGEGLEVSGMAATWMKTLLPSPSCQMRSTLQSLTICNTTP